MIIVNQWTTYEEPEEITEDSEESDRVLPPSKINPKTGKIDKDTSKDAESKDDNTIFVAPEEAQEPFDK